MTASWLIATKPAIAAVLILGALIFFVINKKMSVGLGMILFLPVIGETYRLPFGGDNGILISDIAIAFVLGVWLLKKLVARQPLPTSVFKKPLVFFTTIAVFSLLLSLTFLHPADVAAGSLYLIRFIEYTLLALVTLDVAKTEKSARQILACAIFAVAVIAIAGFIQLIVYPDLGKLEEYGWDPHINRLVSTWLDPNFVGGLLAFSLAIIVAVTLSVKGIVKKLGLTLIIILMAAALFMTYSRSAYIAAAFPLLFIGLIKSRKLLITMIFLTAVGINFLPRAQERINDLTNSVQSLIFNTNQNPDATARLRIQSWQQTLDLIQKRPLLGSGYNTLKYVKYDEGFVRDTQVHSASGSDSSLLTIFATTGILGLIAFIALYWNLLKLSWATWQNQKIPALWQGYGLGIFAGTLGLLIHSLFVNSLLFPQIMIFIWICAGLLEGSNQRLSLKKTVVKIGKRRVDHGS